MQKVEQLYEQFERFAANTLSLEVGFQQWWEVIIHSWLRSDSELMNHALHNLAAECFLEASELMNMSVDHVVESVIDTFKRKNAAYGNDKLDNFYRVETDFGINPVAGLLTRMSDKMSRIENLRDNEELEQVGEALQDTFVDLGAYALITMMIMGNSSRAVDGYKYAEAGVSVDDPVYKPEVIDEYRKYL